MKDQELLRLPRREQKLVVRGWNASAAASIEVGSPHAQREDDADPASAMEGPHPIDQRAADAMTTTSRPVATPPSSVEPPERPEQCEPLPLTVWHVRHAYRARARRVEQSAALKAAGAVHASRDNVLALRRAVQAEQAAQKAPIGRAAAILPAQDASTATIQARHDAHDDREQGLSLDELSASRISSDAAYRDEVLGDIRRRLAAGRRVTLRTRCAAADEPDRATDARLALQLLCSLSLLHCARDQGVVPQLVGGRAQLELLPRVARCEE